MGLRKRSQRAVSVGAKSGCPKSPPPQARIDPSTLAKQVQNCPDLSHKLHPPRPTLGTPYILHKYVSCRNTSKSWSAGLGWGLIFLFFLFSDHTWWCWGLFLALYSAIPWVEKERWSGDCVVREMELGFSHIQSKSLTSNTNFSSPESTYLECRAWV